MNQARLPMTTTWVCKDVNGCGLKPKEIGLTYDICTMKCLEYSTMRGGCENTDPNKSIRCAVGQPYEEVKYSCKYDGTNNDVCDVFPAADGLVPCNLEPCLDWTKQNSAGCKKTAYPTLIEGCGIGKERWTIACPEASKCNPMNKPPAEQECTAINACAWVPHLWNPSTS